MKKLLALLSASILMFTLSGCETMKGLGKDLEKLGGKIEDAASK